MAGQFNFDRLCQAINTSRLVLRRYREERREAVREYIGHHWSEEGARRKVPVNLISLYISVISRNLIAKNPRVLISTFQKPFKPIVNAMQTWANSEIEHMNFANTMERIVLDALFSIGICKVAIGTPAEAAKFAWGLQAGAAFAERVDLDDFVYDVHARDFSEVGFIGHRFRVPLEVVRESKIYSKARKTLTASTDPKFNREGDERISVLGRGYNTGDSEEYEDFVDLWEVYCPRQRCVYTFADDDLTGPSGVGTGGIAEPLREQDWLGPDAGPYRLLGFGVVPGNAMFKAPIQDLVDLHESANHVFRKLLRQAERQKQLLGVMTGSTEDAQRITNASDGEAVRVDNPDKMKVMEFGGPSAQNFALFMQVKELFSYLGGNLDIMGGRSPQSKTATQDKILNENASLTISDMQQRTVDFVSDVVKGMCWYWWHDPFKIMRSTYSLPGMPEFSIQRAITPQQRQMGRWEDLDIKIDPYSLRYSSPEAQAQKLMQVMQQILIPMAPVLQQQGIVIDMNQYVAKLARYMDMPDLGEILTLREPPQEKMNRGPDEMPRMPLQTERTYTRENIPMRTERGNNMDMMNQMLGMETGGAPENAA